MWIRKMKEKLRHPGIFLKILILFECILIIAVLVTSSYIIQNGDGKGDYAGRYKAGQSDGLL